MTLSVDAALQFRHMLVVPEREVKNKEFSLWKACNELLWKGKIVQDTPESIEEALTNQSEVLLVVLTFPKFRTLQIFNINLYMFHKVFINFSCRLLLVVNSQNLSILNK